MSIGRIYYCDGPDCGGEGGKDSPNTSPIHAQTATPPPHLPSGFMELRGGQRSEDAHFCSWDCLMKYAAKHPPDERVSLSDVPDPMTVPDDQVVEALRNETPLYSQYLKIVTKEQKRVFFDPNPAQLALDAKLEEQRLAGKPQRAICLKARQVGISTYVQAKLIQRATLRGNHQAVVVAHDKKTAGKIFKMGQGMWANLPEDVMLPNGRPLKPKIRHSRTGQHLHFAPPERDAWMRGAEYLWPDSEYTVDTANEFEGGRGATFHSAHLSELAFWANPETKLTALKSAVPKLPDTLIVIESTANGHNFFKEQWDLAVGGESEYVPFFWPWWKQPEYRMPFMSQAERDAFVVGEGRWGEEEPKLIQRYGLDLEQLHWRRDTIANESSGRLDKFKQEYPACLTAEMRVSTERGIIPISEARGCKRTESGPIKHWGRQVESPIWKLTTRGGRVLRGTADHPVLTQRGLVGIKDLEPGDDLTLRPPMFAPLSGGFYRAEWSGLMGSHHSIEVTPRLARFMGYFMGDGSWHKGTTSIICDARDEDVIADVRDLMAEYVGQPQSRTISRVQGRRGAVELRVGKTSAREFYERLGMVGTNGSGAWRREVCVPEAIWRSPRRAVLEFLRGLFEADGSASSGCVRWASSKIQFARDVQLLLLGCGFNAPLTANRKTAGSGAEYTSYVLALNVEDSRWFHEDIGFVSERKGALRPAVGDGRRAPRRPMADAVASVEEDGFEHTWDFNLATDDHLFQSEGIVTHNSAEEAFLGTGARVFDPELVTELRERIVLTTDSESGKPGPLRGVLKPSKTREVFARSGTIEVPAETQFTPYSDLELGETAPWKLWLPTNDLGQPVVEKGRRAVIGVDVSGGEIESEGGEPAYHAIQVIDLLTGDQLAEYVSRIDPDLLAREIWMAALMFGHSLNDPDTPGPMVAIERTGSWGQPMLRTLWFDYHYPRLYRSKPVGKTSEKQENRLGWDTSGKTKPLLLANGQELLRTEATGIRSRALLDEMFTYVRDEKGATGPEPGKFSDRLMAWLIAQQVRREQPIVAEDAEEGTPVSDLAPVGPV